MIQNEQGASPATERVSAPGANWTLPRNKELERRGEAGSAYSHRHPQVRGGICEFCGVLDGNVPSHAQYKLCPHYRGMQLRCTYCPESKEPDDIIYHSTLNVAEHPDNPSKLIVWCNSFDCSKKHIERFKISNN